MKTLQKASKFLSDYTSAVVIAIAVVTFLIPQMMGWVDFQLFTDMVGNKFTSQSLIIGIIMFSMGLTLTAEDFKIFSSASVGYRYWSGRSVSDHAISCFWDQQSIAASRCHRFGIDSGRMLPGRCFFQHHVLSVWRGCGIFRGNDNGIYVTVSHYDAASCFFPCQWNEDRCERTSYVRIHY